MVFYIGVFLGFVVSGLSAANVWAYFALGKEPLNAAAAVFSGIVAIYIFTFAVATYICERMEKLKGL